MFPSLRFSVPFLFAAFVPGLFVVSAEARVLSRRAAPCVPMTPCTPTPQRCYGPEVSLLGEDLTGWTAPGGGPQRGGWSMADGVLLLHGDGGDLVTERQYKNFVLDFEWTIAEGGNSGIKYRYQNFASDGWLGLEYQILDDFGTPEGNSPKNNAAALYDILPPNSQKSLNPADQINRGKIVVNGNRIEHWLNGKMVVCVVVGSKEWNKGIAASKFDEIKGFGINLCGHIMLQDHGSDVRFHKLTIQEILPKPSARKPAVSRVRCR